MEKESRDLRWVTSAAYVGPFMVATLLAATLLAVWFALDEKFSEAIITLLVAVCFLLVGVADLIGELIILIRRREETHMRA